MLADGNVTGSSLRSWVLSYIKTSVNIRGVSSIAQFASREQTGHFAIAMKTPLSYIHSTSWKQILRSATGCVLKQTFEHARPPCIIPILARYIHWE